MHEKEAVQRILKGSKNSDEALLILKLLIAEQRWRVWKFFAILEFVGIASYAVGLRWNIFN